MEIFLIQKFMFQLVISLRNVINFKPHLMLAVFINFSLKFVLFHVETFFPPNKSCRSLFSLFPSRNICLIAFLDGEGKEGKWRGVE